MKVGRILLKDMLLVGCSGVTAVVALEGWEAKAKQAGEVSSLQQMRCLCYRRYIKYVIRF